MNDNIPDLIKKLIELSEADQKYTQTLAEKNKYLQELEDKKGKLSALEKDLERKNSQSLEKKRSCDKHEKYISGEKDKLVERRKSLSTLNDYKLQQKAEKEIEQANKQLSVQEDKLLEMLDQSTALNEAAESANNVFTESQQGLETFQSELEETLKNVDERLESFSASKEELSKDIEPAKLNLFNRIAQKYPGNAIVHVADQSCSGCFFSLGPQVVVNIARAKELITCQSCGRILYLPPEEEGEKEG